jgi:hypothetical protein
MGQVSVIGYQQGTGEGKRRFPAKLSGDSIAAGKQDAIWEQLAVSCRLLQVFW